MRDKQPLALLKAMTNSAKPARDFKAAILKRAAETGLDSFVQHDKDVPELYPKNHIENVISSWSDCFSASIPQASLASSRRLRRRRLVRESSSLTLIPCALPKHMRPGEPLA